MTASPSKNDDAVAVDAEEPPEDVAALKRCVLGVRHVDWKQYEKFPGAGVTDEVEDGSAYLLGDARFDLYGYVADNTVDSRRHGGSIIHLDSELRALAIHGRLKNCLAVGVVTAHVPNVVTAGVLMRSDRVEALTWVVVAASLVMGDHALCGVEAAVDQLGGSPMATGAPALGALQARLRIGGGRY